MINLVSKRIIYDTSELWSRLEEWCIYQVYHVWGQVQSGELIYIVLVTEEFLVSERGLNETYTEHIIISFH